MVTATTVTSYVAGQVANVLGAALTHPLVTGVSNNSVVAQQNPPPGGGGGTGTSAATTLNDIFGKIFGVIKDIISPAAGLIFIVAAVAYFVSPANAGWKQKSKEWFKVGAIGLLAFAFGPQILALLYSFISSISGTNITAPTVK